jgi:hypothetical protein
VAIRGKGHLQLVVPVVMFVVSAAVFATQHWVGYVPSDRLVPTLGTVLVMSLAATISGWALVRFFADLEPKAQTIRHTLGTLHATLDWLKLSPVSDDDLKLRERRATQIRIISPDLRNEHGGFKTTVLDDIREGKTYAWIIPDSPDIVERMDRMTESVRTTLKLGKADPLPMRFRCLPHPLSRKSALTLSRWFDTLLPRKQS